MREFRQTGIGACVAGKLNSLAPGQIGLTVQFTDLIGLSGIMVLGVFYPFRHLLWFYSCCSYTGASISNQAQIKGFSLILLICAFLLSPLLWTRCDRKVGRMAGKMMGLLLHNCWLVGFVTVALVGSSANHAKKLGPLIFWQKVPEFLSTPSILYIETAIVKSCLWHHLSIDATMDWELVKQF